MTPKILAVYGLKWNPFLGDVPVETLWRPAALEHFLWRMEQQVREGGFALITGDPGSGKSAALRVLAHHLAALPDVRVGVIERPQSGIGDFYRELGALFGISLVPHNRWASFRALRDKWIAHVEATRFRPVLLVDEAQEMSPPVLAELRLLASTDFDSRSILTTVLVGDGRLVNELQKETLLPIGSRIRVRLTFGYLTPKELLLWLEHSLREAGNPQLMTPELMSTLAEHAAGNLRVISTMANELLALAVRRDLPQIDQKLFLETYSQPRPRPRTAAAASPAK